LTERDLFNVAAVILAIRSSTGERDVLVGAVLQQRAVQELAATVGVQTAELEWQTLLESTQRGQHGLSTFVAEPGTADPTSGDIDKRQRVQERASTGPSAVGHQIDLHKSRLRFRPIGERLDGHLVLPQRARSRGAQPAFWQAIA